MKNKNSFSRIIAGTMTWGSWGKKLEERKMTDLMQYCLELGITTFDHADIYGGYTNEAHFGEAFAQSSISREDVQLISKCGIQIVCDSRDNDLPHYQYSTDYIIYSVEQSLKNLKTDYLDLLLMHRPSPLLEPNEVAEAAFQLEKAGKIKSFGVSNFTPSQIAVLETAIQVTANQVEFSLTANEVMYDGTLDDCIVKNRMAMSWSTLGSYFKENDDQVKRIKAVMKPLMEKYNASADQLLLAWVLKHPSTVYPVVGTTSKSRLVDSLAALNINLELKDWFILLEASQGHPVP